MNSDSPLALCAAGITKRFGGIAALSCADMNVRHGSIHALVGENGAGKSTLISIISGLLRADSGSLSVNGKLARFNSPLAAATAGIGTVHQHFMLAEALTVAENIALGMRRSPGGWHFPRHKVEAEVARLSAETGLLVDARARVGELPIGLRQRVEILKALSRGARILLLDEPTAVLAPPEVETLFGNLRRLRDGGRTIVIVTHKLNEVLDLASETTVLRRGVTVFAGPLGCMTPAGLAEKMIGRAAPTLAIPAVERIKDAPPVLEIGGLSGAVRIASLCMAAGEIFGIAGVEGNGQQELAEFIAGTRTQGDVAAEKLVLGSVSLLNQSPSMRSRAGLAYIPADRQREGLVLEFSLTENLYLREPLARGPLLNHRAMRRRAAELLPQFGVRPPLPELEAGALSGGNQQKVIVARELGNAGGPQGEASAPRLVLACNPTRGLDVGAAAAVHERLIDAARKRHAAVLLISSDLDEILALSDRIGVLYRGALERIWKRGVGKDEIGRAMVGVDAGTPP